MRHHSHDIHTAAVPGVGQQVRKLGRGLRIDALELTGSCVSSRLRMKASPRTLLAEVGMVATPEMIVLPLSPKTPITPIIPIIPINPIKPRKPRKHIKPIKPIKPIKAYKSL